MRMYMCVCSFSKCKKHTKNVINVELFLLTTKSSLNWINFTYFLPLALSLIDSWYTSHTCNTLSTRRTVLAHICTTHTHTHNDYRVYLKMVLRQRNAIWINSAVKRTKIVVLFSCVLIRFASSFYGRLFPSVPFSKLGISFICELLHKITYPKTMTITLQWVYNSITIA